MSLVFHYTIVFGLRALAASGGVLFPIYLGTTGSASLLGIYSILYTLIIGMTVLIRGGYDSGFARVLASKDSLVSQQVLAETIKQRRKYIIWIPLTCATILFVTPLSLPLENKINYLLMILSAGFLSKITIYCFYFKSIGKPSLSCFFELGFVSLIAMIFQALFNIFELTRDKFGLAFFLSTLFLSITLPRFYDRKIDLKARCIEDSEEVKDLKSSAMDFMKMNAFNYLQQFSITIISSIFVSATIVGSFKLIERFSALVGFPLMAINTLFVSYYGKQQNTKLKYKSYFKACILGGGAGLMILLGISFLSLTTEWDILSWYVIYTEQFYILSFGYLIMSIFGSSGVLLNAVGLHKHQLKIMIFLGLFSLPTFIIMSAFFQLDGMILAMTTILIMQAILPILVLIKVDKIRG